MVGRMKRGRRCRGSRQRLRQRLIGTSSVKDRSILFGTRTQIPRVGTRTQIPRIILRMMRVSAMVLSSERWRASYPLGRIRLCLLSVCLDQSFYVCLLSVCLSVCLLSVCLSQPRTSRRKSLTRTNQEKEMMKEENNKIVK